MRTNTGRTLERALLAILAGLILAGYQPASADGGTVSQEYTAEIEAARAAMFGNPSAAYDHATKARVLSKPNTVQRAEAIFLQGDALVRMGQIERGLRTVEEAEAMIGDAETRLAADVLMTKAQALLSGSRRATSLEYLQRAHEIYEAIGDSRGQSRALSGIAILYQTAGYLEKALEYYDIALATGSDPNITFSINHNRASILAELERFDEARAVLLDNIQIADQMQHPFIQGSARAGLVDVLLRDEDVELAEKYLDEAMALASHPSLAGISNFLIIQKAELLRAKGSWQEAADTLAPVFADYDFTDPLEEFEVGHQTAFRVYERIGDLEKAITHLEAYTQLNQAARQRTEDNRFALLNAEFDSQRKDLEIANLRSEQLQADVEAAARQARSRLITSSILITGSVIVLLVLAWHLASERKSAAALRKMNKELEDALAARTRFLASTSHEIRTPLNAIIGMGEAILDDKSVDEVTEERLRTMMDGSQLLLAVINDILDAAKLDRGEFSAVLVPTDVSGVIRKVANLHEATASAKNVALTVQADLPNALYKTDQRLLEQAIGNLVSNAVKFTDRGAVEIVAGQARDHIVIEVKDTGIGVPVAKRGVIFESFSQADDGDTRRFGGTGLGLAIVKHISHLLGGDVQLTDNPRGGSIFTFTIAADPVQNALAQPTPKLEEEKTESKETKPFSKLKVLVVEDNKVNQLVLMASVGKEVARIDMANDGFEGIAALDATEYDVILMDHHMPNMSGLEATKRIKENPRTAGIPIIGVTAEVDADAHSRFIDAGMYAVVTKPINKSLLLNTIAKATGDASVYTSAEQSFSA